MRPTDAFLRDVVYPTLRILPYACFATFDHPFRTNSMVVPMRRMGWIAEAATTARWSRWATPERLSGWPRSFGKIGALCGTGVLGEPRLEQPGSGSPHCSPTFLSALSS